MMKNILNVARLQLVNKATYIWVPLIVTGGAWLVSTLIFWIIRANTPADAFIEGVSGAGQAPIWVFLYVGITSLTNTFPFALAMSVTRRSFYLGTALITAAASAGLATLYSILRPIEIATNGWGVGNYMFAIPWLRDYAWWQGWLLVFILPLVMFVIGFWFAAIYKRYGAPVGTLAWIAVSLLIIAAVAVITWQRWWPEVGAWFGAQTPASAAAWIAGLVVVLGASSYLSLRRLTP